MAIVFCEFCGDYDFGATVDEIILWREKAGICGGDNNHYVGGDFDDIADNFVLLWYGVFNFGGVPFFFFFVGWLATKLLDFHIAVVEFFGGMKSFLIEIEPYQTWVFLIYLVIFVPLVIGLIRQKMVKLREENYQLF